VKVAILGAGALGVLYGVRLACHGGADVAFVVRRSRVAEDTPFTVERVGRRGGVRSSDTIDAPTRTEIVPGDADVILLAVGTEDLEALERPLGDSEAPIVILTPMLPRDWARVRKAFGERAHAAMPPVAAYVRKDGIVRYWLAPAPTRIDEPRSNAPSRAAVEELAASLSRAGLRARLDLGVHERNPATTVCLIPIGMALALAGSVEALEADDALLALTQRACREGVRFAARIGEPEPFAPLAPVFAAPWALRLGFDFLRWLSPEAIFFAEEHFGRKLKAQHAAMIGELARFAEEKGLPCDAFLELGRRFSDGASGPAAGRPTA
jgi:ketopantoate reductase